MPRIVGLSPLFHRRLDALGVRRGSAAQQAVGATIAGLAEAEQLPGVLDTAATIPPTARAFVRRVAGRNLWLWYRIDEQRVTIVTITKTPPVPHDG